MVIFDKIFFLICDYQNYRDFTHARSAHEIQKIVL